tara:strand:- start:142 stop:633 length:492 start_codon:yes stop_codon:yes gene_type:complete
MHFNLLSSESVTKMKYIRTPETIWESLNQEFNFTIDACASDKNHLVERYWTIESNALKQNWDGEIVYCHPMYDQRTPQFIRKAVSSNCLSVFLLPSSTNSVYFHKYLWNSSLHKPREGIEVRFLAKVKGLYGYKFLGENNEEPKTGYLRPLMIVVIDKRYDKN